VDTDTNNQNDNSAAIGELPVDELIHYGRQLGLSLDAEMIRSEILRRIRERQELLAALDRRALLDIVIWARRPVRESASKEQLAREIAAIGRMDFNGLSDEGLKALAKLRGVRIFATEPREMIEARLRDSEPFWDRVRRKRRSIVGSLVSKIVHESSADSEDYRFLPEDKGGPSLKEQIADEGLVGGLARKIRGAADDYVREKLDEIEARIDHKLDEIDRRLAEWRDREIANRLRIIKITLFASVLVAVLSLAYNFLKSHR
jgi:hypothetical protein